MKRKLEKETELLNSILQTKTDLAVANKNFECTSERELIDYYSYQIKANKAKLDYLIKQVKENKIELDMINNIRLQLEKVI